MNSVGGSYGVIFLKFNKFINIKCLRRAGGYFVPRKGGSIIQFSTVPVSLACITNPLGPVVIKKRKIASYYGEGLFEG